jgi:hypothetical protein
MPAKIQSEQVLPQENCGEKEEAVGERRKMGGRKGPRLLCGCCSPHDGFPSKSANKEDRRSSQCHLPTLSKKSDFCWATHSFTRLQA